MRKLPMPSDTQGKPYDAVEVFDLCIGKLQNQTLKGKLKASSQLIGSAASEFRVATLNNSLHLLPKCETIDGISSDSLEDIYTSQMAKEGRPGRPVYDRIRASSPHNICPLCGVGAVTTLDHHVPKTKFPKLSVTPFNLVPACMRCQSAKKAGVPNRPDDHTIHPYFDDFEDEQWLAAKVIEGEPAVFSYYVKPPGGWDSLKANRAKNHLMKFELPALYGDNASHELESIRHNLSMLHTRGGLKSVREHLLEQAESRRLHTRNSWQTAMYQAAGESDWFCDGGFR